MNILFVEDNPGDAQLMKEAFKKLALPHAVHVLDDGSEVLSYLRGESGHVPLALPDLILLDLNLPKMAGSEVLRTVKQDPAFRHIPVIIFTSSQSLKDVNECYASGANSVLTKPFDFSGLLELVKSLNDFWLEKALFPSVRRDLPAG